MNENLPQMQDEALVDQMEQQLPLAADGGAPS
jgi:hypothetical protein